MPDSVVARAAADGGAEAERVGGVRVTAAAGDAGDACDDAV